MFLIHEPAWRYLLFMGFICVYSLFRIIAPLHSHHQQKWQRIRKIADRALQERRLDSDLVDTRIKVTIPTMPFVKRARLALELLAGSMVFLISLGWGMRLLQTAIHTHRGIVSASEGDDYRATKEYQLALKSDPVGSKIHWAVDAMQSEEDRKIGDLYVAQVYARLHPGDAEAYNTVGAIYVRLKRYKEAIKAYRTGLMLRPNFPVLHSNLGSALSADLQIEAAIDEFQHAITEDPRYGPFHINLGDVYFYKHDLAHAEEEYLLAIRYAPNMIHPYWRISEIRTRQGKHEEARAILRDLLSQSHMPEDAATIGQIHSAIASIK